MHDPVVAVVHFLKAVALGTVPHALKEESDSTPHFVVFRHSVHPLPSPKEIRGRRQEGKESWTYSLGNSLLTLPPG